MLGCEHQLVDDAVWFFYSEVRRSLTEMKGPIMQIDNLGSFKVKAAELPKLVHKYEKHLGVLKPETYNQMATKKDLEIKLERVTNLMKMIKEEKERKVEFYNWKNGQKKNSRTESK